MRFIVCRLPMTFDEPRWFVVDTVTWAIVHDHLYPYGVLKFPTFREALRYANETEVRT